MPATLRYAPLLAALGDGVDGVTKELEVYATRMPPPGYTFDRELEGVDRAADAAGFDRFHLYGHSGGGAVALAYAAARRERVLSLAIDEPASDFSPEAQELARREARSMQELPPDEAMAGFVERMLSSDAPRPAPPRGPPPPWMANRPAGVGAFAAAMSRHDVDPERFRGFDRPVYYSFGSLSDERWSRTRDRLAACFPDFTAERYEGLSHLETSHVAEPERVARALRALWDRAG